MSGAYRVISNKVNQSKTSVIWELKGWQDSENFGYFQTDSHCNVDIRDLNGPRTSLRFRFKKHTDTSKYNGDHNSTAWLSLAVHEGSNIGGPIYKYIFEVDFVDDKLEVVNGVSSIRETKEFTQSDYGGIILKEEFIKVQTTVNRGAPKEHPRPEDLRIRISVTPIYISTEVIQHDGGDGIETVPSSSLPAKEAEGLLCGALKKLFVAEENYADLKLDMKDNMTLSAHKFILAARSPVLQKLIESEVKKEGFNGTIKLAEVNAKPMVALLYWMYTEELHENTGKCMEEVVDAAILFELVDLIRILDKKVVTICTRENMFQLYKTAEKNGMVTAIAEIKEFIRENL